MKISCMCTFNNLELAFFCRFWYYCTVFTIYSLYLWDVKIGKVQLYYRKFFAQ